MATRKSKDDEGGTATATKAKRSKKTSKKTRTTKAAGKKTSKKTTSAKRSKKATKSGGLGRRSAAADDVGELLLKYDTIPEMVARAGKEKGINAEKLANVTRDHKKGVHPGLLRMRIGNLIRGARNRR